MTDIKAQTAITHSTMIDTPPLVVVIQGGKSSGKSTLIRSLVKYYTNQNISAVNGSITVRNSKNQRITFYECSNDLSALVDLAKIADVAIVLIDARVGFEMETFEFISLLKNHGFTSIAGVITHMDDFKVNKSLSKYKKQIKKRFLKDATDKAKLYYLYGVKHNLYIKTQLHTLSRFLKVVKPNVPGFRQNHPYLLCDRYEVTVTNDDDENVVSFFGYVRGNHFSKNVNVHVNGLGDFAVDNVTQMDDPCPIEVVEAKGKVKRTLKRKDRNLYAPYCNVNTLEYDRQNGYITIPERLVTFTRGLKDNGELENDEGVRMVRELQEAKGVIEKEEGREVEIVKGVGVSVKERDGNVKEEKEEKEGKEKYKEFVLKNEPEFYDERKDMKVEKMIYNDDDKDGDDDNDIVDTYKDIYSIPPSENATTNETTVVSTNDNNEYIQHDLQFLIKNAKQRFVTGGTYTIDNDEPSDDASNANDNNNTTTNNPTNPQPDITSAEPPETDPSTLPSSNLAPFLNDPSHNLYQLGTYIRVDIKHLPRKYITHFTPSRPLILATLSLQETESQMCYLKIKFTKHLWYPKILKTNDPLILSVGWRKFQTTVAYCTEDKNMRLRLIKYTPKFTNCFAICYGPSMPINIAIVALQNNYTDRSCENFRICGTGDLIEVNHSFNITKKLKLIGEPEAIYKNTAYIKNMFNSNLEVARYIGAKLQTASGIRGVIKKHLNTKPEGRFRATFEDKILKSDIVFLKTWTQVELNTFYNPIVDYKHKQPMLRTMAQLRKDNDIELVMNKDSEYKEIQREEQVFPRLVIGKNLEKQLPFKNKNKDNNGNKKDDELFHLKKLGLPAKRKLKTYLTDNEKNVYSLLQRLQTLRNVKEAKRKQGKKVYDEKQKAEQEKDAQLKKKRQRERTSNKMKKQQHKQQHKE